MVQVVGQTADGTQILTDESGQFFTKAPGGSALTPLSPDVANSLSGAVQTAVTAGNVAPVNLTTAAGLFENARQFDTSLQLDADQFNATNQFNVDEANQAARLRVAELNASLRGQQGQLTEQVRQFDIQDARERENMRFLLRKEQVATEEGNRAAFQSAVALQEQISSRLENNRFQRQQLVTEVGGLNAQIENNVRVFNAQEKRRVEQLNEQRRQANLQQLQSVSSQIGDLASNPADVGKLAAFLRSGNASPISSAIARGENAVTDESLLGLRGLLGVREGLQQGPTQASANLIEANLVDMPQFGQLGQAPDVGSLYNPIAFDPSGIAGGPSPAAGDLGQFYQPIVGPGDIGATPIGAPGGAVSPGVAAPAPPTAVATPVPPQQLPAASPVAAPAVPAPGPVQASTPAPVVAPAPSALETDLADPDSPNNLGSGSLRAQALARGFPAFVVNSLDDEALAGLIAGPQKPQPSALEGDLADPDSPDSLGVTPSQLAVDLADPDHPGLERGGVARPGQPVIVGDSSDGKENQELAMVDARGNLVVVPLDQLPRAEEGGLFQSQFGSGFHPTGEPAPAVPVFRTDGAAAPTPTPRESSQAASPSVPRQLRRALNPPKQPDIGSMFFIDPMEGGDPNAPGDWYRREFERLNPNYVPQFADDAGPWSSIRPSPSPVPTAPAQLPAAPPARTVQQTAQNPAVGTGQVGLVSPEVARMFLTDVQRDALRRGGFTDPTQVSPLKVSAPGTSRFLQDLSASVAGTMGFGPPSLFFEELQRLRPTAVRAGVGRRTA